MIPGVVPNVAALRQLAERWGISRQAAQEAVERGGFPEPARLSDRIVVWDLGEVEAWEQAERDAGRPLPGERPRGPRRQQPEA